MGLEGNKVSGRKNKLERTMRDNTETSKCEIDVIITNTRSRSKKT